MSQRQTQLQLVFGNSIRTTGKLSPRQRMLLADLSKPSQPTESPFLLTMRELERLCPAHADVLRGLANDILKERMRQLGLPPLE